MADADQWQRLADRPFGDYHDPPGPATTRPWPTLIGRCDRAWQQRRTTTPRQQ